jgi:TolB protein
VYSGELGGSRDILIVPSAGGSIRPLTADAWLDSRPDWSPDGTRIAFASNQPPGIGSIWVAPAEGGTALDLGLEQGTDPAWSPDGQYVAYSSRASGTGEIFVVSLDGGLSLQITDDPADDRWPSWSPDGRYIAFMSDRAGYPASGCWSIWVAPVFTAGVPEQRSSWSGIKALYR